MLHYVECAVVRYGIYQERPILLVAKRHIEPTCLYKMSWKVFVCVRVCVCLCNVHGMNCVEYISKAFSSISTRRSDGVERVSDQIRIRKNEWTNIGISKRDVIGKWWELHNLPIQLQSKSYDHVLSCLASRPIKYWLMLQRKNKYCIENNAQ